MGYNLNGGFMDDVTNLMLWAIENDHLPILMKCVENGADIHVGNSCALRLAAAHGRLQACKLLVEKGANYVGNDWNLAASLGHLEVVAYLKSLR
jgi:ankyrin repeat protein